METKNETLIKKLNDLAEINNDRVAGYEKAASQTDDSELKSLFNAMASHSRTYKSELATQIRSLGGQPTDGTKTSGKIFRAWMDIKSALTAKNRKEILKSCETGEDAALETYSDVLKSDVTFPEDVRKIIVNQQQEIQKDHGQIKSLKDAVVVK